MLNIDLKELPRSKVFHFIGIDGIGMSSIAEVLFKTGFGVQGSNEVEGENMLALKNMGAKIFVGHNAKNIDGADYVVFSSAVPEHNVEMVEAKKRGLTIIERAEMLQYVFTLKKSIAVSGTHGKTTTTSFVGTMLDVAGMDATIIDGGIMNRYNSNAKVGNGDFIVAEACEAFGNIKHYTTDIAVITNIDAEHMEYYKTFDNLKNYFRNFISRVRSLVVACADHPVALELAMEAKDKKTVLTYALDNKADVMAENITFDVNGAHFDIKFADGKVINDVSLPLFGRHNVLNTLASVAVAKYLGISDEKIKQAVSEFTGTKHRFTKVANVNGLTIFDDYGHHPKEIETTLAMARSIAKDKQIFAIFQPHRYSRLTDLFNDFLRCFKDADYVICMPVYAAGESDENMKNHCDFYETMQKIGGKKSFKINKFDEVSEIILSNAKSGAIIVSLGAGNIKHLIYTLPDLLTK
ncbi:MAG: UDP-N-acetylmuramate--L-alanine ligase [Alphaproteobacteria bacterium]|nr:UDP-N-acetylmuramate--L-alanine ligase [Alphaproteobacteria bacterium]